jgi:two-component system cell cycle sensor histidine kinase/response regulator CckA
VTRALRVLHLEDNPRDAAVVRHKLDADGLACDILVVDGRNGFEAALTQEPFGLILIDHNLPGYDGVAALEQAQRIRPDVPVILISGTVDDEEAVKVLHLGATDYLLKDRLDRLVPAIRRALREAETQRTRRRAEAALYESEARKAAILDSVLDCIVTMDAGGAVIEFNAAAARTFGYTKAEAVGRTLADLMIPPRFRERHHAGLAAYMATGEGRMIGKTIEITAMRADGTELPMELSITAIGTRPASIFTGVLRDITPRRQAEATRARLAAIVDSSDDAIFSMAMDDTILTWNAGAERLYGYAASEAIGRGRALLVPAGNSAELVPMMARAAGGDGAEALETLGLRKDGAVVDISLVISPMTDSTGRITSVSIIARDITRRKKAESALQTAEERTRFALEAAGIGIWDMDCANGSVRLSEIVEAQYGLRPGTFRGTFEAFIQGVHPDDRPAMHETIGKATRSGADFSMQHRALWSDGTIRWLRSAGRYQFDADGKPVRGIGISQDITERRALEDQYQQAQKMEAIGRLAAGVAHDFNNLLTVILGLCELLLAEPDPADSRQADILEIQTAAVRAAGLTRQLLTFSRKQILQPTLLDLNVIVADVRLLLGRLIGEDVEIVLALGGALPRLMADRGQVEQVILNLAINGRDAMPRGGTLTIATACVEAEEPRARGYLDITPRPRVALTVTDTGTGMTPEVRARLFEPFFTTKAVGKGTGLGLATVDAIVRQNGGTITVDSEVGRGTSFTLYFPQADPADDVAGAAPPMMHPPAGVQTVLVVEDAAGLGAVTRRLLERLGYSVLVAADADEALLHFDRNPAIDLLLTDVVMPRGSGPELVAQLTVRRPTLKVIYMSGYTDDAIVHHGVLDAGVAFLHKPFTSDTLGQKLREVFER